MYDPNLGRLISEDPIGFAGGDANLYSYVSNNSVNLIDPSGNEGEIFNTGMSIAGGGLVGFGGSLSNALSEQNMPSRAGQAKLGFGTPKPNSPRVNWHRTFHFDGPHSKVPYPTF